MEFIGKGDSHKGNVLRVGQYHHVVFRICYEMSGGHTASAVFPGSLVNMTPESVSEAFLVGDF